MKRLETHSEPGWLFAVVVLLSALCVLWAGITRPNLNFDMVGYVAAAHHRDGARGEALSSATWDEVRREAGPEKFRELTSGDYRATVHASSESLTQQLPFYSIRVAYVEALRLAKAVAGWSYPKASYLLSAGFAALAVGVLGIVFARLGLPLLLFPAVVFLAGFAELARYSTPDALVCLGALSLVAALLRRSPLVFAIAALMPLLRTDFILLSLIVLALAFLQGSRAAALLSFLAALALYLLVNKAAGNYGYLTIFNFTFLSRNPFPAEMPLSSEWRDYLAVYRAGWGAFASSKPFLVYAAAALLLVVKARRGRLAFEDRAVVVPALVFVLAHMSLFPANFQRFFVFAVSLAMLWIAKAVRDEFRGWLPSPRVAG